MSLSAFDPRPADDTTRRKEAEAALEQRVGQQAAVAALSQTALAETSIDGTNALPISDFPQQRCASEWPRKSRCLTGVSGGI